jgi:hypothetical protein
MYIICVYSANSGVTVGGSEAEKSTTATDERYRATSGVGASSRDRHFFHPEETLCGGTPEQGVEGW